MNQQLMHYPGRIAVLDDDFSYLEALSLALPPHWQLSCYAHPQAFMQSLLAEESGWSARKSRQHEWISLWREGRPLLPAMLQNLAEDTPRYDLTKVLVVDYAMPGTNGLEVLKNVHSTLAARVLLTGQADEQLAVTAFNDRLIDQFLQKHSVDVGRKLTRVIEDLSHRSDCTQSQTWNSMFEPALVATLARKDLATSLHKLLLSRWVEYIVLSNPLGVLGFDAAGRAGWLQLETQASVQELVEVANAQGVADTLVREVQDQRQLLSLEVQQILGGADMDLAAPCIRLGTAEPLLAAWFELPKRYARAHPHSFAAWMRTQSREVIG